MSLFVCIAALAGPVDRRAGQLIPPEFALRRTQIPGHVPTGDVTKEVRLKKERESLTRGRASLKLNGAT